MDNTRFPGLTGNQLKILALITMTCDHVGLQLLPQFPILRIIGRLAFPIFAYMIAEGCRYTHDRRKYLLSMVWLAAACQLVYFFAMGSLYMSVLVSFSLAIGLIYLFDYAQKWKSVFAAVAALVALGAVYCLCAYGSRYFPNTDFAIDYGFWGILLPVLVYFSRSKEQKLLFCGLALALISREYGSIQWFCLLSLPPLALYNGTRGKQKMKNLFYIYYPAHLVAIYALSLLL